MKKILVVYFSQTGQLKRVVDSFVEPLNSQTDILLVKEEIEPLNPYPFPWPFLEFIDQFPEAVYLDPPDLKPFLFDSTVKYDLVILAYTVWFLSPSPPIVGFLKSDQGRSILRDTPVITLIACRNMWLQAQEQVKQLLSEVGARHIDNVVLTDRGSTLKTLVTTPRWMLTGRRNAFLGIFPRAGITDDDIDSSKRFGRAILSAFRDNKINLNQSVLNGLKAVAVNQKLISGEKIGRRSFQIWGKLFRAFGKQGNRKRRFAALIYSAFLFSMVFTVVPITMAFRIMLAPLRRSQIKKQCEYFSQPSGNADFRIREFS